jgi:hypothetical protein
VRINFHIDCLWRKFVACVFEEVDWFEDLGIGHSGGRHVRKPYGFKAGGIKCQKLKPGEKLQETTPSPGIEYWKTRTLN